MESGSEGWGSGEHERGIGELRLGARDGGVESGSEGWGVESVNEGWGSGERW